MGRRNASLGETFKVGNGLDENQVQRRVENLTNYIQSLQQCKTGEEPGNQGRRFYESAATFSSAARLTMVMEDPFTWISFFRLNSANVRETVSRDAPTI